MYNLFSGHSLDRLAALSDGVFAVAMTLLVLDLRVPAAATIDSEHDLGRSLAAFIAYRLALLVYWLNIFLLGAILFASWRYVIHATLLKDTTTAIIQRAVQRRIVIAQALYAVGAVLCVINTSVSIVVIVLVQLNYVIAPRIRPLYRL